MLVIRLAGASCLYRASGAPAIKAAGGIPGHFVSVSSVEAGVDDQHTVVRHWRMLDAFYGFSIYHSHSFVLLFSLFIYLK